MKSAFYVKRFNMQTYELHPWQETVCIDLSTQGNILFFDDIFKRINCFQFKQYDKTYALTYVNKLGSGILLLILKKNMESFSRQCNKVQNMTKTVKMIRQVHNKTVPNSGYGSCESSLNDNLYEYSDVE